MQQKPLGYIVIRSDGVVIDKDHNVLLFQDRNAAARISGEEGRVWPIIRDQPQIKEEEIRNCILITVDDKNFLVEEQDVLLLFTLYYAYSDLVKLEDEPPRTGLVHRRIQVRAKARAVLAECKRIFVKWLKK